MNTLESTIQFIDHDIMVAAKNMRQEDDTLFFPFADTESTVVETKSNMLFVKAALTDYFMKKAGIEDVDFDELTREKLEDQDFKFKFEVAMDARTEIGKVVEASLLGVFHWKQEGQEITDENGKKVKAFVTHIRPPRGKYDTSDVTVENLRLKDTYERFGIGFVKRGDQGRKVHGGEMVPGPWAYTYGLATAIVADPKARERMAAERDRDLIVEDGDQIEVDGVIYRVRVERGQYIKLDKVN